MRIHSWGNLNQWTDPPINWDAVARQATKVDDSGCSFPKCGDLCICNHCSGQHEDYERGCDKCECYEYVADEKTFMASFEGTS